MGQARSASPNGTMRRAQPPARDVPSESAQPERGHEDALERPRWGDSLQDERLAPYKTAKVMKARKRAKTCSKLKETNKA